LALAVVLLLLGVSPARAREGVYIGVGAARQTITGDLERSQRIAGSGSELRAGKAEAGSGFAVGGGYGFNAYVALDLLVSRTRHDTLFEEAGLPALAGEARLTAALFGVRATAPLGEVLELFGRAGVGGYELDYRRANIPGASGAGDDALLTGRGAGLGVGAELILDRVGVELALTRHRVDFESASGANLPQTLATPLSARISTVSLMLNYHF
jgi:hypothetical protein